MFQVNSGESAGQSEGVKVPERSETSRVLLKDTVEPRGGLGTLQKLQHSPSEGSTLTSTIYISAMYPDGITKLAIQLSETAELNWSNSSILTESIYKHYSCMKGPYDRKLTL